MTTPRVSFSMNSSKLAVSLAKDDVSMRERLKLLGARWCPKNKFWEMRENMKLLCDFLVSAISFLGSSPVFGDSDDFLNFIYSRWQRFESAILIHDNLLSAAKVIQAWEHAFLRNYCGKLIILCSSQKMSMWERSLKNRFDESNVIIITHNHLRNEEILKDLAPHLSGAFVIFDNPCAGRRTKLFDACSFVSLPASFRLFLLDAANIKNIETIENAVLLCDPSLCPPWEFYKNHITITRKECFSKKRELSIKSYRAENEFLKRVSPIISCDFEIKNLFPVNVKAKPVEKRLFRMAKSRFREKLASLALDDAVVAGKILGENIPENYLTAKEEKLIEIAMFSRDAVILTAHPEIRQKLGEITGLPVFCFGENYPDSEIIAFDIPENGFCNRYFVTDLESPAEEKFLSRVRFLNKIAIYSDDYS